MIPKTEVEFKAHLGSVMAKSIELRNPSSNPIIYDVTLEGSPDFRAKGTEVGTTFHSVHKLHKTCCEVPETCTRCRTPLLSSLSVELLMSTRFCFRGCRTWTTELVRGDCRILSSCGRVPNRWLAEFFRVRSSSENLGIHIKVVGPVVTRGWAMSAPRLDGLRQVYLEAGREAGFTIELLPRFTSPVEARVTFWARRNKGGMPPASNMVFVLK